MSTMQDRMKIAPPAGGAAGMIACRSTNNNSNKTGAEKTTPVQQKISAFEDSVKNDARKERRRSPVKKGEDRSAEAALEKNVSNRCNHLADDKTGGGSHKNTACSSSISQNNNFLHDNDFTFIDADDELQSIHEGAAADPSLGIASGDSNGCDCTDNAGSMMAHTDITGDSAVVALGKSLVVCRSSLLFGSIKKLI